MRPGLHRLLTRCQNLRRLRLWLILSLNLMAALLSAGFVLLALTRPLGAPGEPRLLILAEDHLREEAARVGLREGRPWRPASEPMPARH